MSAVPTEISMASGLDPERAGELARLVDGLPGPALLWVSGYAAGLAAARGLPLAGNAGAVIAAATPAARVEPQARLTVVYGSQTGNSQRLAERLAREAEAAGLAVRVVRAGQYPQRELATEKLLYLVVSTQGDGDPPDDARAFYDFLRGRKAPKLPGLQFAVLALGDSSYPKFCETGRVVDERLADLGATRLLPRADLDVDYDKPAAAWVADAIGRARDALGGPTLATITPIRPVATPAGHDREHPHAAEVLANQRIAGRASSRDVRHLELSLADSGLTYEPGDALGVVATNAAATVDEILQVTGLSGDALVTRDAREQPLRHWLTADLEVTRLTRPFLVAHADRARTPALRELLASSDSTVLRRLLRERQLAEVLAEFPADWDAQSLVGALRSLAPRMYSIASSQKAVGDEVHLTVAVVDDLRGGVQRPGTASPFLAAAAEGARVPVFIERNERFRLPADDSRDIIMVGPGTGVAPFRGFVQQRAETGASGRNWLFFGARHFASEFLYQLEWQAALKAGALQRLDLAFSRDQQPKVYVQQRLAERGREIYDWLERGAYLYVCGDAERMAPDVNTALIDVIATHGGLDRDGAAERVAALTAEGRYLRDVY